MEKLYFDYNFKNRTEFRFIIKHNLENYNDLSLYVSDGVLDRENKILVVGYTEFGGACRNKEGLAERMNIPKFDKEIIEKVKNITVDTLDPTGVAIKRYSLTDVSLKEMIGNTAIYNFKDCLEEEFVNIDEMPQ